MKIIWAISIVALGISACNSTGRPTDAEIRKALSDVTSRKGCATSTLLGHLPISGSVIATNQAILTPLVNAGLLEKAGETYALTKLGSESYDEKIGGFCYTPQYVISDIVVRSEEPKSELPPALSGAWYVTFKLAPSSVSEWVKRPDLIKAASLASLEKIVEPTTMEVRLAKKVGQDELIVADPRFLFIPGIHFNMGF